MFLEGKIDCLYPWGPQGKQQELPHGSQALVAASAVLAMSMCVTAWGKEPYFIIYTSFNKIKTIL